jgi:D-methionine transport system ATP-binding protein
VYKKYGELTALDNVNLQIYEGEIFGIVGQSGAGKSTLLRTINRLEEIENGEVLVDGENVVKFNSKKLREFRRNCGMIFQHFSLMETKTVYKNIALPLECNHYNKEDIKKRVLELAEIVGLSDKLDSKPRQLSGGQKQRVAIARALALNPQILLCDEATSALDPITTEAILQLLRKINEQLGITIVIVTHQMEVVKSACERIAVLRNGDVLQVGNTDEIFLSSDSALKTLIKDYEILPKTGVNIRLFFPKSCSVDYFITKLARELDVDFSICAGKLERFRDDVLGTLIINIKDEDKGKVLGYIASSSIGFEVIDSEV